MTASNLTPAQRRRQEAEESRHHEAMERRFQSHHVAARCGELLLRAIDTGSFNRGGRRSGKGVATKADPFADIPPHAMTAFLEACGLDRDRDNRFDMAEIPSARDRIAEMLSWHQAELRPKPKPKPGALAEAMAKARGG